MVARSRLDSVLSERAFAMFVDPSDPAAARAMKIMESGGWPFPESSTSRISVGSVDSKGSIAWSLDARSGP